MEIAGSVKSTNACKISMSREGKSGMDYTKLGMKGQIIVGTIAGVSEKISIDFNGTQVQVPKGAVHNAREGEQRSFEIRDVSKNSIVLKEVENGIDSDSEARGMICTIVDNDQMNFADYMEMSNGTEKEQETGSLDSVSERMTGEDCNDIEQEGMSIEKYELERLERALERIKQQRQAKQEGIDQCVEHREDYQKEIEKVRIKNQVQNIAGSPLAEQIANALTQADLPVTEANIKKVSGVMYRAAVTPNLSESAMNYMLENALEPTIENVYHAQYAGSSSKFSNYKVGQGVSYQSQVVSYESDAQNAQAFDLTDTWQEIAPQAEKMLTEDGIEVTDEVMEQAKWLFEHDLPITGEMIENLTTMQDIKEQYDPEVVLEQVTEGMARGENPEEVSLLTPTMSSVQQAVDTFLTKVNEQLQDLSENDFDISVVTKRRQLEEVRLKMTADSASRLQEKGIDLNLEHIEEIIDGLRDIEDAYYQGLLQESGVVDSQENIAMLRDTQQCVQSLKDAPNVILGTTLVKRAEITLEELQGEGAKQRQKFEQAETAYETLMTKPDRQLGDSIQKAFRNVDAILEDLGMQSTEENQRAVRILAHNTMPITEENIYKIKEYDSQVNKVINDLHPAVTVELIRRNINPLQSNLDELDTVINGIKEELGISEDEKYSKYLYQLEQRNSISQEDRQTFINIYRLLNNVQKMDGAAVGYVVQTDRELTLENLYTAIRTLKNGGVEMQAADSTDMQDIKYSRGTLLSQMQETFSNTEEGDMDIKAKYYQNIVEELTEEISPSGLEKMLTGETGQQKFADLMKENVEELLWKLKEANRQVEQEEGKDTSYEKEKIKILQQVSDNSDAVLSYLRAEGIPVTVENVIAASQFGEIYKQLQDKARKLPKEQQEEINDTIDGMADALEDADTMQLQYERLEKQVENILQNGFADRQIHSMGLQELRVMANSVGLARRLAGRQDYQIPVQTGENITTMHVTILNGTEEQGKVTISTDIEGFGEIRAEFMVNGDTVEGTLLTDSKKASESLRDREGAFEDRLKGQGMELGRVIYGLHTRSMEAHNVTDMDNKKNAAKLYAVAKTFVKHIAACVE